MILTIILIFVVLMLACVLLWVVIYYARMLDASIRRDIAHDTLMRQREQEWIHRDHANDFMSGKPKVRRPYVEVHR